MGFDFLDTILAIEKQFGVHITPDDVRELADERSSERRWDLTAKDLHDLVCRKVSETGRNVPPSSWHRLQLILARTLGVSPKKITPNTWLVGELEMH